MAFIKILLANWQGGVRWKAEAGKCLKIQSSWPMPEETERIGKLLLDKNDPYRLIGAQLFEKWKEESFADLYASEGKPGYSPVNLVFILEADKFKTESIAKLEEWLVKGGIR